MEAPLKQRLIGATVLAAIALIFVPMLLKSPDVKDSDSADVPLQIPVEADSDGIKTIDIPLDGSAPIVTDALLTSPSEASTATSPVTSVPANSSIPDEPATQAPETAAVAAGQYAVVIPAKNDADAKAIVAALQTQNLGAKIQSNGQLFRVRLGPYSSRELAELARLRSTTAVTGGTVVAMDAVATPLPVATDVAKPIPTAPVAPLATTAVKPPVSTPTAITPTAPAPVKKPDAIVAEKGFAVQLGAPANEQAAIALRDKARTAGFSSFIQPVDTETGRRYRVRIGPEHNREAAKLLLASAKQKLGIDGIVVLHP
jgi:cell division septation protein DedD